MDAFHFKWLARSQANLGGVNPLLKDLYSLMVEHCPDGLFPVVVEGVRSSARQQELRRAGLSWANQSRHQTGDAIDVVLFRTDADGIKVTYEASDYQRFASALRASVRAPSVVWGGRWKQRDYLHWEVPIGQVPPVGGEGGGSSKE